MGEIKTLGYYVNGEWKKSSTEHYTDAFDPSTGEVIAKVPVVQRLRWRRPLLRQRKHFLPGLQLL